jgi:hypothetical protein
LASPDPVPDEKLVVIAYPIASTSGFVPIPAALLHLKERFYLHYWVLEVKPAQYSKAN